jgi:hypothetical protein
MRLFLSDGPSHIQIVSRGRIRELRDRAAALELLRPLAADPRNMLAIRNELRGTARTDEQLLEELARRIVDEGLQIVSCADAFFASVRATAPAPGAAQQAATTPLEDEQAAAEERQSSMAPKEEHWIEIELLDDAGVPVADELYLVELPDGTKLTGRTDSAGKARVEGVDPGTAKVSFPDLDKAAYTPQ